MKTCFEMSSDEIFTQYAKKTNLVYQSLPYTCKRISWIVSSENVSSSIRKIYGFTSSCACARSRSSLTSPLIHSIVSNNSDSGERKP